eukprot:SAG11_NODE_7_length_31267_cov_19.541966_16_plen_94_part_00
MLPRASTCVRASTGGDFVTHRVLCLYVVFLLLFLLLLPLNRCLLRPFLPHNWGRYGCVPRHGDGGLGLDGRRQRRNRLVASASTASLVAESEG